MEKDHGEFYFKNREVTLTATGDSFVRWYDDVSDDQLYSRTINVTMDSAKYICPYFKHDWVKSGNYIEDGYWKLAVSKSGTRLTVTGVSVNWQPGFLDLSKPVETGEIIVEIGQNALKDNRVLADLRLPETIVKLNSSSVYNCAKLTNVVPFVPKSLVTFNDWCFRYA